MNVDPSEVLNSYSTNKKEAVKFFKELGSMNPNPIPSNVLKIDQDSQSLVETESLMEKKFIEFAKASKKNVTITVARFCLALFLIEHTKKIHETVLTKNRSGLYSLYTSLRNQVCDALNDAFYSSSRDGLISLYLDLEPLLCACSDLCDLSVPDIPTVMKAYKSKVADRIGKPVPQARLQSGVTSTKLMHGASAGSGSMPKNVVEYHTSEAKARELLALSILAAFSPDADQRVRLFISQLNIPPNSLVFASHMWPRPTQTYVISRSLFMKLKDDFTPRTKLAAELLLEGKPVTSEYLERIIWNLEVFATSHQSTLPGEFFIGVLDIKKEGFDQVHLFILDSKGHLICSLLDSPNSLK